MTSRQRRDLRLCGARGSPVLPRLNHPRHRGQLAGVGSGSGQRGMRHLYGLDACRWKSIRAIAGQIHDSAFAFTMRWGSSLALTRRSDEMPQAQQTCCIRNPEYIPPILNLGFRQISMRLAKISERGELPKLAIAATAMHLPLPNSLRVISIQTVRKHVRRSSHSTRHRDQAVALPRNRTRMPSSASRSPKSTSTWPRPRRPSLIFTVAASKSDNSSSRRRVSRPPS